MISSGPVVGFFLGENFLRIFDVISSGPVVGFFLGEIVLRSFEDF